MHTLEAVIDAARQDKRRLPPSVLRWRGTHICQEVWARGATKTMKELDWINTECEILNVIYPTEKDLCKVPPEDLAISKPYSKLHEATPSYGTPGKIHSLHKTRITVIKIQTGGYLKSSIKASWNGDTFGWAPRVGECRLQRFNCTLRLLQLLHQGIHSLQKWYIVWRVGGSNPEKFDFWLKAPPSLPTSPLRHPASSQAGAWQRGRWRRRGSWCCCSRRTLLWPTQSYSALKLRRLFLLLPIFFFSHHCCHMWYCTTVILRIFSKWISPKINN